jgi:hypothetical protein
MASNQNLKRQQPQQNSSISQSSKPRKRKGKMIEIRYKYGENDIWFRMSPKCLAAVVSAVMTLLGLSTANLVLQARNQNPALPASQRVVENPRE